MHRKDYIVVKDRHPRISEVLNDCVNLCVPTCKNEPLSSILQKICGKLTTAIADIAAVEDNLAAAEAEIDVLQTEIDELQEVELPEGLRFGVSGEDDSDTVSRLFTNTSNFTVALDSPDGGGNIKLRNDFALNSQFAEASVGTTYIQFNVTETSTNTGVFTFSELNTSFATDYFAAAKTDGSYSYLSCNTTDRTFIFGSSGFGNNTTLLLDDINATMTLSAVNIALPFNLPDFVDDTAAASGGILLNQLYRNGSVVQIRVT